MMFGDFSISDVVFGEHDPVSGKSVLWVEQADEPSNRDSLLVVGIVFVDLPGEKETHTLPCRRQLDNYWVLAGNWSW